MNRVLLALVLLLTILSLTACTAGANTMVDKPDTDGRVAGFWRGLWHGIIAPITFIISLFTDNVNLYEVHNNGNWYDLGFVLGAGILGGGGILGSRRRHRND
jgi:hypothetical protein